MTVTSLTTIVILTVIKVSMVTVGTASGEPCVFPFIYEGKEYSDCTAEKHERLWCSYTYNYDNRWRECDSASSWSVSHYPQSICAVEGSTVDMSCSYTYPSHLRVQKAYWINSDTDAAPDISQQPQYKGRVGVSCRDKRCSLRINSVKRSDKGDYYCRVTTNVRKETRTGRPGIKLSVTDIKVLSPSGPVREGGTVTLTCKTTCPPTASPSFIWSKDGRPVEKKRVVYNQLQLHPVSRDDGGNYTCVVRGHENLPSPPERLGVMYSPQNMQIQISPSGKITEGSHVTLTCMSEADPPVHTYTWIKKNGAVELKSGEEKTLTFSTIHSEDSGEYLCCATNVIGQQDSPSVTVQVSYAPKNTRVLISYSGVITKGSLATLTCSSDANPPVEKYTWFKVNESTPVGSGQQYSITNISFEDGEYYCEARNEYGSENSTAVTLDEDHDPVLGTVVAVSVSVCGVLGLIGAAAVWLRYHCKGERTEKDDDVNYGENTQGGRCGTSSVNQNQIPKTTQPDAIYQSLNPNTTQPDGIYHSLNPKTTQPNAVLPAPDPQNCPA